MLILLDFPAQSVAKRVTYFKAREVGGGGGMDSVWTPSLNPTFSPSLSKNPHSHVSLPPLLPLCHTYKPGGF